MTYILLNFCKIKDNSAYLIERLWLIYWEQCLAHRKHIVLACIFHWKLSMCTRIFRPKLLTTLSIGCTVTPKSVSSKMCLTCLSTSSSFWLPQSQCQVANLTLIPQTFLLLIPKFWLRLINSRQICSFLSISTVTNYVGVNTTSHQD